MTLWERIQNEPALLSGAIIAIINVLMLFDVIVVTPDQINGINVALAAVLAIFTRQRAYGPLTGSALEGEVDHLSGELLDQ